MTNRNKTKPSDRMPRGAIVTVIVGLIATLGVVGIDLMGGGEFESTTEWVTTEEVDTPGTQELPDGASVGLSRVTLSALPPNVIGKMLFRVTGFVEIDSGQTDGATEARCDVTSPAEDSFIARSPNKRAAWPRPSLDLRNQPVPLALTVDLMRGGAEVQSTLPIRDVLRTLTDSAEPTDLDWDGFEAQTQNWVWTMPEGAGEGGATLGFTVVFESTERPRIEGVCAGSAGGEEVTLEFNAEQQEWPLVEP